MSPSIIEPISCYTCRQEFDHAGNMLGKGQLTDVFGLTLHDSLLMTDSDP